MNKEFLPYYNSLSEKDKTFWLERTKEQLIDHLVGNIKNGEVLLARIEKAIEYIKQEEWNTEYDKKLLDILQGSDKE